MKRWTPYHFAIPLAEGEVPMDKGGFRTVTDKSWSSALEAVVYCKDCKHRPTDPENKGVGQSLVFPDDVCPCQIGDNWYSWMPNDNWFCADGKRRDS